MWGPEEQDSWFAVVGRVSTPTDLKFHTGFIQGKLPQTAVHRYYLPNAYVMLTWPYVTKPLPP